MSSSATAPVSIWDQFKTWAEAEVAAVEGGVEAFAAKIEPVIEADFIGAIDQFGQDVVADVVGLLSGGLSPHETVSTAADNLLQQVEAQGKTIALSTANTIASQAVTAVQAAVGASTAAPAA